MSETPEDFARVKAEPSCLSHWQLSRWAMGTVQPADTALFEAHVADCADCRARWQTERANHDAAAYAPLPEALRQLRPRRFRWRLPMPAGASWGLAFTAVLLVLTAGPLMRLRQKPEIRLKGDQALAVARLRNGVVQEGPWLDMQPMQPGDQVRFKVHTGNTTWQALYMQHEGRWEKLYVGMVPADDWVPTALTVNAGTANDLRLLVCPVAPDEVPTDATVPEGCTGYDASL